MRWNKILGISDLKWLFFGSGALRQFQMSFNLLVPFVVVSKITPAHVEAIVFSLSASIFILQFQLGNVMAVVWNKLIFHVDTNESDNLYKFILFQIGLGFVCLTYTQLIPTWR